MAGNCDRSGQSFSVGGGIAWRCWRLHNSLGGLRWVAGPGPCECKVQIAECEMDLAHNKCALWFVAGGREVRNQVTRPPSLSSSRAYLPQQAAGRIRAESWVLGKPE